MNAIVPTSLMPKGVEHDLSDVFPDDENGVPTSLMPKGVEHAIAAELGAVDFGGCAHLVDAERR